MCGILWIENKKGRSAVKPAIKRYRNQSGRGTEGYGYVSVNADGYISEVVRCTDEKEFIKALNNENASALLIHHRYPTSTPNFAGATHPMVIKDERFQYDYYVVHNGVIRNYKYMFDEYKKAGYKFLTEIITGKFHQFANTPEVYYEDDKDVLVNDSEVFAIDLVEYIEGRSNVIKSAGTIAFIALQVRKDGKVENLIYGRNDGNPLTLEDDKTLFCLRSLGASKKVKEGNLVFKNWDTKETTVQKASGLVWGGSSQSSSGHKNHNRRDFLGSRHVDSPDDDHQPDYNAHDIDDGIEETLRKMLPAPANVPPRNARLFNDFGQNDDLPVIQMEELGFNEDALRDEISAAMATSEDDAAHITLLKDDLEREINAENEAIIEVNEARSLLRIAIDSNQSVTEMESARGLVDAAEEMLNKARNKRKATVAELSSWVGYLGNDDERVQ